MKIKDGLRMNIETTQNGVIVSTNTYHLHGNKDVVFCFTDKLELFQHLEETLAIKDDDTTTCAAKEED